MAIRDSMQTVSIREYADTDYPQCRSLWCELVERHRLIYEDQSIGGPDPGEGIDGYLANPCRCATWVAEAGSRLTGLCGLLLHGEEAEVEPVIVATGFRSLGAGQALVEQAVRHAKAIGVRFLGVRPVARNAEAIRFFVRSGFGIVGQIDLFQDLKPELGRTWRPGLSIHGLGVLH
jgi:ribosomal protein S18 acetylase RimI-like enzyme